jgi:hypothetical protein
LLTRSVQRVTLFIACLCTGVGQRSVNTMPSCLHPYYNCPRYALVELLALTCSQISYPSLLTGPALLPPIHFSL